MATVLIIEDEAVLARNLTKTFSRHGFAVHHAETIGEGLGLMETIRPEVVLMDLRLPDGSGLEALPKLVAIDADAAIIMMTAYGSVADAVQAMQHGARDFVLKPFNLDEIRLRVERAVGAAQAQRELVYYRGREASAATILGDSPTMEHLRDLVARLARAIGSRGGAAPTILLLGETGTGKGHVARAIHASGGRRDGPFIEVNCTALPEQLVEAELFGHERGAFTDAKTARPGLFETADGGTIFLDEIGHVAPSLQAKFLKVVEEKTVRRIGATAARAVDVQVVAATSRDVEAAVQLGEFREDLYQRLSVAVLRIPPLRERQGDAVQLSRIFLEQASRRYAMAPRRLSAAAEEVIGSYGWPGNVRELQNAMERVVLLTDSDPVTAEDLGLGKAAAPAAIGAAPGGEVRIDLPDAGLSLEAVERALLVAALERSGGNQSKAARLLAVSRDTLRYRMEKYGLAE
ncbi:MAG: sigma-54-dependent transcriptional regulator [Candidatus Binatia bacterium]